MDSVFDALGYGGFNVEWAPVRVQVGRANGRAYRVTRRLPVVTAKTYVCPNCRELHEARAAVLPLGCVQAA